MTERILVTGSSGLVGSRFIELFTEKYKFLTPDLPDFDLTKEESVAKAFLARPGVTIHFAAFTDVSAAEKERGDRQGLCWKVNVEGTKNLLEASSSSLFIYISTDMVFSGSGANHGPYTEQMVPNEGEDNLTWYGFTKAQAENLVRGIPDSTVIRIIYPVRAKNTLKEDYLHKPLRLFDEDKLYPLFSDQQISITFIDELCQVLDKVIKERLTGTFHAASHDLTTPYDLVSYLIWKSRGKQNVVQKSSLVDFLKTVDNPVRYPQFGGLDVKKTEKELNMRFSTWEEIVDQLVEQGLM